MEGELEISGNCVDRPDDPLRASIPSGYDPSGFQPSAIIFAGEGCWRVVATAGTEQLTFVTLVVRGSRA